MPRTFNRPYVRLTSQDGVVIIATLIGFCVGILLGFFYTVTIR